MLLKDKIDKKAAWERRRMDAEKRKGCSHVHHDHRCEKCVVYLEKEKAKWEASDDFRRFLGNQLNVSVAENGIAGKGFA